VLCVNQDTKPVFLPPVWPGDEAASSNIVCWSHTMGGTVLVIFVLSNNYLKYNSVQTVCAGCPSFCSSNRPCDSCCCLKWPVVMMFVYSLNTEVCRLVVQGNWLIGSTSQGGDWISTPVCIHLLERHPLSTLASGQPTCKTWTMDCPWTGPWTFPCHILQNIALLMLVSPPV